MAKNMSFAIVGALVSLLLTANVLYALSGLKHTGLVVLSFMLGFSIAYSPFPWDIKPWTRKALSFLVLGAMMLVAGIIQLSALRYALDVVPPWSKLLFETLFPGNI